MGKSLVIIILGSVITLSYMKVSQLNALNMGTDNAISYYEQAQARNMANSMVNILLTRIADDVTYRTDGYESMDFGDGTANFRISEDAFVEGDTLIKVEVEVNFNGYPKSVTSYIKRDYEAKGWVPAAVRGSWTANADLNNTISDMLIDGRDHDLNLNVTPNVGKFGVSSSTEFRNDEDAEIGGTSNSVDYVPTYPEDQNIIEELYNWGGDFPDSPDELLKFPEGTLKSIAQSGVGGSQYLLNPDEEDIDEEFLNYPLRGITYIELTDGDDRELHIKGTGNSGIVIVHGPNSSSRLKGVKIKEFDAGKNEEIVCHDFGQEDEKTLIIDEDDLDDHLDHGDREEACGEDYEWFQGLIVTDYSFHHHIDILGAMVQLSPNLEDSKSCGGNEDHWVKYSSEAVKEATKFAAKASGLGVNRFDNQEGFGHGRLKVKSWFE